ncbi:zinc finger protein [Actinokineospora xionganensis]|uniref:Zinc finger protein n=1 Tax=Actinokineospora xionganensis TaxID=2684470 RepID=A0ABR7LC65_9PSEU|nr:hypothetical protein [Actinokineospora xionganensis]
MRPYQWQGAAGELHAIPNAGDALLPPLPGATYQTVCGLTVELPTEDFRRDVRRGMCRACNSGWIAQESATRASSGRSRR